MSQGYICYEYKDDIEEFESSTPIGTFGADINTPNYTGKLGSPGTNWTVDRIDDIDNLNVPNEVLCAAACYHNPRCTRYMYANNYNYCQLKANLGVWRYTGDINTVAGYIIRRTPTPVVTTRQTKTTKPKKSIIPGVPDLYFYIGLGVVGFIILLIIIMMMSGGSKKT